MKEDSDKRFKLHFYINIKIKITNFRQNLHLILFNLIIGMSARYFGDGQGRYDLGQRLSARGKWRPQEPPTPSKKFKNREKILSAAAPEETPPPPL